MSTHVQEMTNVPALKAGDTVKVYQKIIEGGKERIQIFEGTVIARHKDTDPSATFTVRKVSNGVGVERVFPLYSPNIAQIEVVKHNKVRRAKLYYLRTAIGKKYRLKERIKGEQTTTPAAKKATKAVKSEKKESKTEAKEA